MCPLPSGVPPSKFSLSVRIDVVTAQLNLNSTQLNSSWSDYIITVLPTPPPPPQTFKALPGNVGFQIFAWAPKKK